MSNALETTAATADGFRVDPEGVDTPVSARIDAGTSRKLAAFNAEGGRPSLLGWRSHESAAPAAAVGAWRVHAARCHDTLALWPDLNAAVGLVLADGLERGVEGLVDGLERLHALLEESWDAIEPPLNAGRPAKAWNARKFAIEVLDDRSLVPHHLLRLPWFGLERPLGPCWRACLFANGAQAELNLPDDEDETGHATAAMLRTAFAEVGETRLAELRSALARGRAVLGPDGIADRFAVRARASSEALGGEARGETLSLSTLRQFLVTVQEQVDAHAPKAVGIAAATTAEMPTASDVGTEPPAPDGPHPLSPEPAAMRFDSMAEARAAFDAAVGWFLRHEPGSPVLVPLALARRVDGSSFPDTLAALGANPNGSLLDAAAGLVARLDRLGFDLEPDGVAAIMAGLAPRVGGADDADAGEADGPGGPAPGVHAVPDRASATALLAAHAAHRRAVDPSSPVAMLVERALGLVSLRFEEIVAALGSPPSPPPESEAS